MKITSIKQQVKRPDRYSIYVDGKFAFGLSENGLLASKIAIGQELSDAELKELQSTAQTDKAYGNALRYVAMRPRSTWELQTYLKRKDVDEPVADNIMQRLQDLNLLNDMAFAEAWVANRRLLKATSKRKLRLELKQKHVPEHIIEQVMREDETDERSIITELIAKKRRKYPEDAKLMQYLARQGFGYDDIKAALTAYQAESSEV